MATNHAFTDVDVLDLTPMTRKTGGGPRVSRPLGSERLKNATMSSAATLDSAEQGCHDYI